jgi:hypothetical protein
MSDERKMSQTYYDKADEARAFADYAPFRYGQVAMDPEAARRIKELRASLDPILVDIVDGGVDAAIVEAEAAVERAARSTIVREQQTIARRSNLPIAYRSRECHGRPLPIRYG